MKKKIEIAEYLLPSYYTSALINDDYSGLTDEEEKEIKQWLINVKPGYCLTCSDESYFSWHNDMNNLGSDVLTYYFDTTI